MLPRTSGLLRSIFPLLIRLSPRVKFFSRRPWAAASIYWTSASTATSTSFSSKATPPPAPTDSCVMTVAALPVSSSPQILNTSPTAWVRPQPTLRTMLRLTYSSLASEGTASTGTTVMPPEPMSQPNAPRSPFPTAGPPVRLFSITTTTAGRTSSFSTTSIISSPAISAASSPLSISTTAPPALIDLSRPNPESTKPLVLA